MPAVEVMGRLEEGGGRRCQKRIGPGQEVGCEEGEGGKKQQQRLFLEIEGESIAGEEKVEVEGRTSTCILPE